MRGEFHVKRTREFKPRELTTSPSRNLYFVTLELALQALDCAVPPTWTWSNELGEVLFGDFVKVLRRSDPVVDDVCAEKFPKLPVLFRAPVARSVRHLFCVLCQVSSVCVDNCGNMLFDTHDAQARKRTSTEESFSTANVFIRACRFPSGLQAYLIPI